MSLLTEDISKLDFIHISRRTETQEISHGIDKTAPVAHAMKIEICAIRTDGTRKRLKMHLAIPISDQK